MPKSRQEKARMLEDIRGKFSGAQTAVLADYRGLTVAEVSELRRRLKEKGVDFVVVKNTLAWIAAKEMGLDGLRPFLEGPTAIAFGMEDPAAAAKGVLDFIEDKKKMTVKAGVLDGKVIDLEAVKALAKLPSRAELLARVLGCLQGPLAGLASCLQAPLRGFTTAVDAVREKRAGG